MAADISSNTATRQAACLCAVSLMLAGAAPFGYAADGDVVAATYADPTTRYAHGVLGDAVEWGSLHLTVRACSGCAEPTSEDVVIQLPQRRVFEDLAPRVVTVNAAGDRAALVVESDRTDGARLALYTADGLLAATPFIGTANRWLAPIGAADLDGDGAVEFAYIDRPHLAKTLRVWQLDGDRLTEEANATGFSNHRIGWDYIEGGLRDCGDGIEMVVASGNWRHVVAVRHDGTLTPRVLGPYSAAAIAAAMACVDAD
ncbi:MAG: VCBS repeat-containing protein [Pseudomonadota bacterium]